MGQLELVSGKLSAVSRKKEQLEIKLAAEKGRREHKQTEIDLIRSETETYFGQSFLF